MKPLAIDLYAGLGGWTDGLLATGWDVIGFDIEQHVYGEDRYPAQLVVQDVLTLHGSQFKNADLIVASPPCQEYSWMAMPWGRAKQVGRALRGQDVFPDNYKGSRTIEDLNRLFNACFRIQREACEAAGRHIPMVVENVRGAEPWVGRARWNFGSFYLWGDVPAMMPPVRRYGPTEGNKRTGRTMCYPAGSANPEAVKGRTGTLHWQDESRKVAGFRFDGSGGSFQTASVAKEFGWSRDSDVRNNSSKSPARIAASARIAKIPATLSAWIGQVYLPKQKAA